jgi:glycosyltransferase involved in cell wall biosynthesis
MRLAIRHVARCFCVSEDIARDIVSSRLLSPSRVFVVPNAVNMDRFGGPDHGLQVRRTLGIPPEAPVVGTVGRLSEQKRLDLLLQGFASLRMQLPAAHLLVVGDGPLSADLHSLAARLNLFAAVHFVGFQSEPAPYLQAMDVFVQTSEYEGTPLAVLEAWAASRPILATKVGGLPQMIQDGSNGELYEFGDLAALVEKMNALLRSPERARKMGEAGRRWVDARFSLAAMAKEYRRHYVELLGSMREISPCGRWRRLSL